MSKESQEAQFFLHYALQCNFKKLEQLCNKHSDLIIVPEMAEYEDGLSWNPEERLYHAANDSNWEVLKLLINYHIEHHINTYEVGSKEYLHGQYLLRIAMEHLSDEEEGDGIELPDDIIDLCEKAAPSDGDTASEAGFDDLLLPDNDNMDTSGTDMSAIDNSVVVTGSDSEFSADS